MSSFEIIGEFEDKISRFFGSKYAVMVDSCTHGIELCMRYKNINRFSVPKRTYLSVPMLGNKLNIPFDWRDEVWDDFYYLGDNNIIDAAVLWKRDSYIDNTFMNISFQYQKHLSLGRGGVILTNDIDSYRTLKKMSYDGRLPNIPWREQNIDMFGYHYYMTPETAKLGIDKLDDAINTKPRKWVYTDWVDLTTMEIFND